MGSAKYKVEIRLYSPHDLDLLSYWGNDRNIIQAAYVSLKAFAAGERFLFVSPENMTFPTGRLRKYFLNLDQEFDHDVIHMLGAVSPGARNNFIRCIMRAYILTPTGNALIRGDEMPWFRERFLMLHGDIQTVSLGEKWLSLRAEYKAFQKKRRKKEKEKKKQIKVTVLQDPIPKKTEDTAVTNLSIPAPMEETVPDLPEPPILGSEEIKERVPKEPEETAALEPVPMNGYGDEEADAEPLFDEDALTAAFDALF